MHIVKAPIVLIFFLVYLMTQAGARTIPKAAQTTSTVESSNAIVGSDTSDFKPRYAVEHVARPPWTKKQGNALSNQTDFWKELERLGDGVHQYAEEAINNLKLDPVVTARIEELKETWDNFLDAWNALHVDLMALEAVQKRDVNTLIDDMTEILAKVFERLKTQFPPPDQAPNHEQRKKSIHEALTQIEEALVTFLSELGMSEDVIRAHFSNFMPPLENVMVTIGDLAEQHPVLFGVLLIALTIPLWEGSEFLILRSILNTIGFGPYGPIKGSAAAWAQRVFFGATVKKGSWFASLQSAAMSPKWSFWKMIGIKVRL